MKLKIGKYKKHTDSRKFKLETTPDDFFNLNSTLSMILVPLLKEFKSRNNGTPYTDLEDIPDFLIDKYNDLRESCSEQAPEGCICFPEAWDWMLDEMIIGFENIDDVEDRFSSGEFDFKFEEIPGESFYQMVEGPNHTYKFDSKEFKKYCDRMENGRRLFAKYFNHLWI